ncbi:hypothetical protein [Streptosporangium carneum]|uniref:DUF916 domain-containing protein n=1 Tax=Streptosporangium carneum TaxID=47481 RepID=A0A9W6I9P6_9ACTN|nr:hypothetical protein [Streptosporangium carneum]GLK13748.1 hypothetical protein GCM10017600_71590 [Streptosporangium carneum]
MIVALLTAGVAVPAVGPGASGAAPRPDFSLTVSPTRLLVGPEHIDRVQTFQVSNDGRLPIDIVVNRTSFTADKDGKIVFAEDAPYSAADWIKVSPASFHLAPDEDRQVTVRIAPPENPDNGEHQVAVLFVAPPGSKTGADNIKINRAIGTPIYVTVPGPVDTSVRVGALRSAGFSMGGPVDFGVTVDNLGTVHRDFFGREGLSVEVNGREVPFPDFTVLRGTSRDVTVRWADPPLMCVCHAEVSLAGAAGTAGRSVTLLIFPLHLFAMLLGVAVALYVLVRLARRRYRAHLLGAARALRDAEGDGPGGRPGGRPDGHPGGRPDGHPDGQGRV